MSRQTWMDRTIDATRDTDVALPWSRKARREAADSDPKQATANG